MLPTDRATPVAVRDLRCKGCHASIHPDALVSIKECPYCGSVNLVQATAD